MPFLIIVLAQSMGLIEALLTKKYSEKHARGGMIFTAIVSLASMLFFLFADIITDQNGLQFTIPIMIYGLVAGLAFCSASFITFIALGCGSFVLSKLILSYGVIITVIHGLFLRETLSVFGWLGIALIVVSLYFMKGDDDGEQVKINKKWVITIGLSVLLAGLFGVLQRQQQKQFNHLYDNEFMIVTLAFSGVILLIVGLLKDGKDIKDVLKYGVPYSFGAGLVNGASNLLNLLAYTLLPMSLVGPIGSGVAILISFIVSKLVFKEKFSKRQLLGVVLGGIALILFNL